MPRPLDLSLSAITSFSDSIGRLTGIRNLSIPSGLPELEDPEEFILMLVQRYPLLEELLVGENENSENLNYALACNRARSRTPFGTTDEESIQTMLKLWPRMLKYATRAFMLHCYKLSTPYISGSNYHTPQPDTIYRLLVDGRESFVRILMDRNNTKDDVPSKGTKGT